MPVETKGKYIRVRIKDPEQFAELKWITLSEKDGIYAVYGRKKDSEKWEIQAYRFDKEKWTQKKAEDWVKENEDEPKSGKYFGKQLGPTFELGGEIPEWVQVFPFGKWEGHPVASFQIDERVCELFIANFEQRAIDLVIDYEHQTEMTIENGQPAPASGWIDGLEIREDGLWGHVKEWTATAQKMLTEKEYRYFSPIWTMRTRDPKTGKDFGPTIHSCGLTNTPFFMDMKPLVAKDKVDPRFREDDSPKRRKENQTIRGKETAMTNDEFRSALYEVLSLQEATDAEVLAKITELGAFVKKLQGIMGAGVTDQTAMAASLKQLQDDGVAMGKVRELLKLSAKADEKEVTAKLYPLMQPNDPATGVSREEFATLQATVAQNEADKLVGKAMEEGKLTAAMRDWALGYAKDSPEGFQAWAAKAPAIVPLGGPKKEPVLGDGGGPTDQQKMIAKQLGVDAQKVYGKKAAAA